MRGPIHIALALLTLIPVAACGAATPPAPPAVTAPPEPADAVPWPDLTWTKAKLPAPPAGVESEHIAAIAADPSGFMAVGFHEADGERDGAIWFSPDGRSWDVVGVPAALAGVDLVDVAAGPGGFVALGTSLENALATTVVYLSADGRRWERLAVPGTANSYGRTVAGGPGGYVGAGNAGDGGTATWMSRDGRTWEKVAREALGDGGPGVIDPQAAGDGWVALGANPLPPVLLRSSDGIRWSGTSIEDTRDTYANWLVVGRWGLMVVGGGGSCGPLSSCASDPLAWWSGDGGTWTRVPLRAGIANGGAVLVEAGDHGIIQLDGANARSSTTGWSWTPLPEPGDGSAVVSAAVVRGDVIVAVGETFDPIGGGEIGRIIVAK